MESKATATYAKRNNKLKLTKFKPVPAINQKNYYTDYLKRDSQLLVNRREAESPDESKVIVIAPGSRNLKIGRADDPSPRYFPMVAARKSSVTTPATHKSAGAAARFAEKYPRLFQDFEERMRFYKREIVTDAEETVSSFNDRQSAQLIEGSKQWTQLPEVVFCDDDVDPEQYNVSWPIQNGTFNEEYDSVRFLFEDLIEIFKHAMKQIGVPFRNTEAQKPDAAGQPAKRKERANFSAILVIPDLYEQFVVTSLIDILLKEIGLGRVAVIQESLAATYGIGLSSACVINIGAQVTQIACVDEGMSLLDSRVTLAYGGDDVTRLMATALDKSKFPLKFDLENINDFKVADALKQHICTANDSSIAVQLDSVIYRTVTANVKYEFKYYEQAITPILGLFYPEIFDPRQDKFPPRKFVPVPENIYTGGYDDPISDAQINIYTNMLSVFNQSYKGKAPQPAAEVAADTIEDEESRQATPMTEKPQEPSETKHVIETIDVNKTAHVPLDYAVIESIHQAATKSGATEKQFYDNLVLIGGGSQFSGLDEVLIDRLMMWRRKSKDAEEPQVTALPQNTSGIAASWKGACVYAKLKIIDEMWVEASDWAVLGSRVLQYKTLFS